MGASRQWQRCPNALSTGQVHCTRLNPADAIHLRAQRAGSPVALGADPPGSTLACLQAPCSSRYPDFVKH